MVGHLPRAPQLPWNPALFDFIAQGSFFILHFQIYGISSMKKFFMVEKTTININRKKIKVDTNINLNQGS